MLTQPEFSVVIPVYNNVRSTRRAVLSVLDQSLSAREIILVDDASSNLQAKKLRRWARRLACTLPVQVHHLPKNVGPGLARHFGANAAIGTHVAFLDSDDVWHQSKLEVVATVICERGGDLIGHQRPWSFALAPDELMKAISNPPVKQLTSISFLKRNPIPTSSITARRAIACNMFRYGERKSEDYMALVVAAQAAHSILYIDAPLCRAFKPDTGHSGEGADQLGLYRASLANMLKLFRLRQLSLRDLLVFVAFLAIRVPVGMLRHWRNRYLSGKQGGSSPA